MLLCALFFGTRLLHGAPALSEKPQLVLDPGFHTAAITRLAVNRDGSRILTACNDKTARLFDSGGRLVQVLRVPRDAGHEGKLNAAALTADGKWAAVGGWTGVAAEKSASVYLFETASGRVVGRISGLPGVVTALAFPHAGNAYAHLAITLGSGGLKIIDCGAGSEVFSDSEYAERCLTAEWDTTGRVLVTAAWDGKLRIYSLTDRGYVKQLEMQLQGGQRPCTLALDGDAAGDGLMIAVAFVDRVAVDRYQYSQGSIKQLRGPDCTGLGGDPFQAVSFVRDANDSLWLVAGGMFRYGREHVLVAWPDGGRGQRRLLRTGSISTIMDIKPVSGGGGLIASYEPRLMRFDGQWKISFAHDPVINDFRDMQGGLSVSDDGLTVGYSHSYLDTNGRAFSVVSRSLQARPVLPRARTNGIPDCHWINTMEPRIAGRRITLEAFESARCFAVSRDATRCVLGATWSLRCFDDKGEPIWNVPTPGETWAVTLTGDGRYCLAAYSDGTIRWHDLMDGRLVLTFFPHADGRRWALWTPDGLYAASAGGDEFLRWHINAGPATTPWCFPVSRLKRRFYAPGLIRDLISGAVTNTSERPGTGFAIPPEVRLLPPREGTGNQWTRVRLPWLLRNPSGKPLGGVRVMVDGRPVTQDVWGLEQMPAADGEYAISLPVPPRSCVVSIVVRDHAGVWGEVSSQRLEWTGPAITPGPAHLYIVSIGISQYNDPSLDLDWAHKDAADVAVSFGGQHGGMYDRVTTVLLTNRMATRRAILDALQNLAGQASRDDTLLVFFAGHGQGTTDGSYYLLPQDVDRQRFEATALPVAEVRRIVSGVRARVGLLLDACYAGSSAGTWAPPDTDSSANDFSAPECGAAVLASSTGEEQSLELAFWKNGLFTSALVEGMRERTIAQSGLLTTRLLHGWLEERMPQKIAAAVRQGVLMQTMNDPLAARGRRSVQPRGAGRSITQTPVLVLPAGVEDFPLIRAQQ